MRLVLLILCLLLFSADASANNAGQVVQIVGMIVSFIPGFQLVGLAIMAIGGVYGAQQAQAAAAEAARQAQEAARQSFNNALRDRTITRVGTDSPHVYIYGRARVGSSIVAMFTSGAKDEFKHLVCIHAAHECDAIEEIYISGNALGALDGNGDVTGGLYAPQSTASVAIDPVSLMPVEMFNGNVWPCVQANPIPASVRVNKVTLSGGVVVGLTPTPFTLSGRVITITSGIVALYAVYYDYTYVTPMVRVTKHLGVAGDPADAALVALGVGWLPSSTLTGLCYTVIRLNLNQPEFQGGIPPVEALIRGRKLLDVRTSTVAWSQNPALATYDYLISEMCGVPGDSVILAGTAQAAAAQSLTLDGSASTTPDIYSTKSVVIASGTGSSQQRNVVHSNFKAVLMQTDPLQLLSFPTDFTNAVWGMNGWSVTPNNIPSPSGMACRITSVSGADVLSRLFTATATSASFYCIAKAGTWAGNQFLLRNNTTASILSFDNTGVALGGGWFLYLCQSTIGINIGDTLGLYYGAAGAVTPGTYFWIDSGILTVNPIPFPAAIAVAIDTPWSVVPDATSTYRIVNVSDIPVADYITAANVCDEPITIGNLVNAPRYVINGTITADQDQAKMLDALAQCMAGGVVGTTWSCWAGKYIAPVQPLDQSDIVGALSVISGTPDADLYNGVKGQYIGAENAYVVTDFTPYQNSAYVTSDGGQQWNNIDFLFTDTGQRIWNLCRMYLEDQRLGFTVKAVFSLKCWARRVGDRVTLTSTFLGQSNVVYRITDKKFGQDQGVELTLKADASTVWDLIDAVTVQSTPATNLISPFAPLPAPGNLTVTELLYQTTGSVGVRSKATVSWNAIADSTVVGYEFSYKPYATGVWIVYTLPLGTTFTLTDAAPGMYDFKVRAFNNLGVYSAFTPMITTTLYGLTAAPANITGFGVLSMAGMAWCSWNKTPDLDVKIGGKVAIRHCPLTTGATWEQSYLLEEFNGDATSGFVPLYTGTYYAKFVDSTGHYSDTAASFVVTESYITGFTTVFTTTQQPTFAGAKTNVFASGGLLSLLGATLVDSLPLIDTVGLWDSAGGIVPSGTYTFDATVDLGTSASRRFFASLATLSFDTGDMIDQRLDLIDTWAGFDGSVINDTDVTLFTRISDDNITFGPWTPFMIADFKCRYAQFQTVLSTVSTTHNIAISTLSVAIKTSP